MKVSELIEVTADYLNDPRHTRYKRPALIRYLNSSQRSLARKITGVDETFFQAIEEFAVVSDDDTYEFTLPADFTSAFQVERLDGPNEPIVMTRVPFQSRFQVGDSRFLPAGHASGDGYGIRGQKLWVANPATSYTLRLVYNKSLPALSDDSTVSEIPLDYHDLLCLEATKYALGSGQQGLSDDLEQLRKEGLHDMLLFVESRDRTGPEFVEMLD